ncbi:MAG: AraC family transcriptional regulator ligand-binding domain-containing protein [Panacagrimonas sp.]
MRISKTDEQVPLITLPNWVKAAAVCGFSIAPVLDELGIKADLVHVEKATIPRVVMERMMAACVSRSKQRHFPLVLGETFAFEYLPELETFLTTSPTLRESTRIFEWLRVLMNPLLRIKVSEEGDVASLRLDWSEGRPPQIFQWFVEATFVSVLKFGRALLLGRADFRRASFQHARPAYANEVSETLRLPVAYGQPHNALEMDRRLLDLRLGGAFESLHRQAEQRVAQRLSQRPPAASIALRLEHAMERNPALMGEGIVRLARELDLQPRTLQRRLALENLRFAELQASLRLKLASTWLADPDIDIETISERLGFADRRSFTRAFSRWTGQTPSAFRLKRPEK